MTVYVDNARHPFRGYVMCHMTADSLEELHAMADKIGMKRRWFQSPPKSSHPHYDIPQDSRDMAIELGAIDVSQRTGLHYAARLGLEWATKENDLELKEKLELQEKYRRTIALTQKYALTENP